MIVDFSNFIAYNAGTECWSWVVMTISTLLAVVTLFFIALEIGDKDERASVITSTIFFILSAITLSIMIPTTISRSNVSKEKLITLSLQHSKT